MRNLLRASSTANPKAPFHIQKNVRLGTQDFPVQRVMAATLCGRLGVRKLLRASSIANPKAPVYIQKKVRFGIQDFPTQRVIAATLWGTLGVRNLLRASFIANPKAPSYIQKKAPLNGCIRYNQLTAMNGAVQLTAISRFN